jgi:hypothetical protein
MGGSAMLTGGERDNSRKARFAWDFADKPFGFALPTQAAEGSVRRRGPGHKQERSNGKRRRPEALAF